MHNVNEIWKLVDFEYLKMENETSTSRLILNSEGMEWWLNGIKILERINNFVKWYPLPLALIMTYIGNTLVIIILLFGKNTVPKLIKTLRVYYITIAILDMGVTIGANLPYYIGTDLLEILL